MRQSPSTVQKAFKLVSDMEKQLQVADIFKLEFSTLILAMAEVLPTDPNTTSLKTIDKVNSGDRNQRTPKSH